MCLLSPRFVSVDSLDNPPIWCTLYPLGYLQREMPGHWLVGHELVHEIPLLGLCEGPFGFPYVRFVICRYPVHPRRFATLEDHPSPCCLSVFEEYNCSPGYLLGKWNPLGTVTLPRRILMLTLQNGADLNSCTN